MLVSHKPAPPRFEEEVLPRASVFHLPKQHLSSIVTPQQQGRNTESHPDSDNIHQLPLTQVPIDLQAVLNISVRFIAKVSCQSCFIVS